ncbi:MAG TPA: energy transducer TonB [Acidobacteriaceae bacterium]|nr:energy transducer TonB [Acidobacteriaceae bacterium]
MPFSFAWMAVGLLFFCLVPSISHSQEAAATSPSTQQATVPRISGVFIAPVPNAPFSGKVEVVSRQKLADGSIYVLKTINYIARDSHGRTHNESRKLVSSVYPQEPPLTTIHIYDPATNLAFHLDPDALIAKEVTMHGPPVPNAWSAPVPNAGSSNSAVKQEDLGTKMFQQLVLHGTRQSRPPNNVDEFWYSPDLSIFVERRHQDAIWEQTVDVTALDRTEPDPAKFSVPANYQIVKLTQNQYDGVVPGPDGVYKVGGEVLPPGLVSGPHPKFPPGAPKHVQIAVLVSLVVDALGNPQDVQIRKSGGPEFDAAAIEAVKKYKFRPAMLYGNPVPVYADIRVDFKSY